MFLREGYKVSSLFIRAYLTIHYYHFIKISSISRIVINIYYLDVNEHQDNKYSRLSSFKALQQKQSRDLMVLKPQKLANRLDVYKEMCGK